MNKKIPCPSEEANGASRNGGLELNSSDPLSDTQQPLAQGFGVWGFRASLPSWVIENR